MPTRYQPLGDYLAALSPETTTLTLTLLEIEALLGAPLPASARGRQWWVNQWSESSQARVWRRAGWRVAGHALRAVPPAVTFERLPAR